MTPELLTLSVAGLGFLGVVLTQILSGRADRRRLGSEQDRWRDDRRSSQREAWREIKRAAFLTYVRAHADYWTLREEIQDCYRMLDASIAEEKKSVIRRELAEKQDDLFKRHVDLRHVTNEIALYDSQVGRMCAGALSGAPSPLTGVPEFDSRDFEIDKSRGGFETILGAMRASLGLQEEQSTRSSAVALTGR